MNSPAVFEGALRVLLRIWNLEDRCQTTQENSIESLSLAQFHKSTIVRFRRSLRAALMADIGISLNQPKAKRVESKWAVADDNECHD